MADDLELQPADDESKVTKTAPIPQLAPARPVQPPEAAAPSDAPDTEAPAIDSRYSIQELDVFGILTDTWTIVQRRWATLLAITAVMTIPVKAFVSLCVFLLMLIPALKPAASQDSILTLPAGTMLLQLAPVLAYVLIVTGVVIPLVFAATFNAVAGEYAGKPAPASESIGTALGRVVPVLWTGFIVAVLFGAGCVRLVIPGIYVLMRFWFAIPCVMLEKRSGWKALKRGSEIMEANYATAFGLGLLLFIAMFIGQGAAQKLEYPVLCWIGEAAVEIAVIVFGATATVVFYFSSRHRLEQFNLAALAAAVKE